MLGGEGQGSVGGQVGANTLHTASSFSTFNVKLLEELFCLSFVVTFSLSLLLSYCNGIFSMKMVYNEDHIQ